ncbi:hypothetical protein COV16_04465 [Candidatus Woesearchaeota archaeon CG10_big_fil_rev_8_21_14_0_10_34_8]|nr:MAG: hypothetical protein COV16_04465 [Candidatus Woesearchaeota archaeon CG10_big_fil_rev_8_21_14_0_10_34_8]
MTVSSERLKEFGFKEEEIEVAMDIKAQTVYAKTGFPVSALTYRVTHLVFNQSIEENYFWAVEFMRTHEGFYEIEKITDLFTASEHSAFFGNAQQRLGLQQDKVSQFLATIGKMVKELFQLVRELRILDERVGYYEDSNDKDSPSRESAEITLKGIWIDLVEQGAKNPASVFGMARELQFATLPDLFFSIHPKAVRDVDKEVDKLDFNDNVKRVLKRKLRTFMQWKESTYNEVLNRRIFTLKYLRQHFDIIKMYMHWVKPYLRNIKRLQLMNKTKSPDLIAAFEGSLVEIEILCKKLPQNLRYGRQIISNKHVYSVVVLYFNYRSSAQMAYQQEYQRGPLHVGKTELSIRAYAWTQKEIDNYLAMKAKEDLDLLSVVDGSVKAALEALGDELERYLQEAGERISFEKTNKEKEKKKEKGNSALDPFVSVAKGFGELISPLAGNIGVKGKKEKNINPQILKNEKSVANKWASAVCYQVYKEFKKKNGMVHW